MTNINKQKETIIWQPYTISSNGFAPESEAHKAWTSGDIDSMMKSIEKISDAPLSDKHFLMLMIVKEAYKRRKENDRFRDICKDIGWRHVNEFPALIKPLKKALRINFLPSVPTFKLLATVLTEEGSYSEAIRVCQLAIKYGIQDDTDTGFQGRIDRILKKQQKQINSIT